jgi:hypothetical protein
MGWHVVTTGTTAPTKREGYEDLKPTGGLLPSGQAKPSQPNRIGTHELYEFSGTVNERLTNIYHLPHDFVEGTDMFFHVHHLPTSETPTGTVRWRFHYQYAQGYQNGSFSDTDLTQDVELDLGAISAVQYGHIINEGVAVNDATVGAVLRTDGIFIVTIERLASVDTNTQPQIFLELDLHYKSDKTATVNRNDTGSGFTKS